MAASSAESEPISNSLRLVCHPSPVPSNTLPDPFQGAFNMWLPGHPRVKRLTQASRSQRILEREKALDRKGKGQQKPQKQSAKQTLHWAVTPAHTF